MKIYSLEVLLLGLFALRSETRPGHKKHQKHIAPWRSNLTIHDHAQVTHKRYFLFPHMCLYKETKSRTFLKQLSRLHSSAVLNHQNANRGFARQLCCRAGTIDSFSYGTKCSFLCKTFSLFLPSNMAAVQNLYCLSH